MTAAVTPEFVGARPELPFPEIPMSGEGWAPRRPAGACFRRGMSGGARHGAAAVEAAGQAAAAAAHRAPCAPAQSLCDAGTTRSRCSAGGGGDDRTSAGGSCWDGLGARHPHRRWHGAARSLGARGLARRAGSPEAAAGLWALVFAAACGGLFAPVDGGQVVDVDGGPALPFMMNTTNPFHPAKSLSFAHVLFLGFSLTYADTAGLRGYIGQDVTQLGRYYAKTKFGCITHCDSSDFNGIDGILGLGMPDAALASIPEPLFFALSDETGDPANQYILNRRIFTLVGTDSAAELHLGGFDPHSTKHDMKYIQTTSPAEYSVPVSSISLGGHEFLNFASAAQAAGRTSIPGILDSGTSCLVGAARCACVGASIRVRLCASESCLRLRLVCATPWPVPVPRIAAEDAGRPCLSVPYAQPAICPVLHRTSLTSGSDCEQCPTRRSAGSSSSRPTSG